MRKIVVVLLLLSEVAQGQDAGIVDKLLLSGNKSTGFPAIDLYRYVLIAKNICDILEIPTRKYIEEDGAITLYIFKKNAGIVGGAFKGGEYVFLGDTTDRRNLVYLSPKIYILDSSIYYSEDSSSLLKMRYHQSTIIHEAQHYLDTTNSYVFPCNVKDMKCIASRPWEKNAYVVEGYFFLSKTNPEGIERLMKSNISMERKKIKILEDLLGIRFNWVGEKDASSAVRN